MGRCLQVLLLSVLMVSFASTAIAVPISAEQWTVKAQHTLARTLMGESDRNRADDAPIAYVLSKRYSIYQRKGGKRSFERFIRMYSAVWKDSNSRKETIRKLPWGPIPRVKNPWGGSRWNKVIDFVWRWGHGEVVDPCPQALHWGGTMDKPAGHWAPISCGRTANIFYRIKGFRYDG